MTNDNKLSKEKLKIYKYIIIIMDILALGLLIYQIINKSVTYSSYIVLICANIIILLQKPREIK